MNGWKHNIPEEWMEDVRRGQPLANFTSFGCYRILYVEMPSGDTLCGGCAANALRGDAPFRGEMTHGSYPEGPTLFCAECNKELESDYGDPDAEDTEEAV
jgi:hypothetical protein